MTDTSTPRPLTLAQMTEAAALHATGLVDAEVGKHAVDLDAEYPPRPRLADGSLDLDKLDDVAPSVVRCVCGWVPASHVAKRNERRARGIHIRATGRRAEKLWFPAYEAKLAELRADA